MDLTPAPGEFVMSTLDILRRLPGDADPADAALGAALSNWTVLHGVLSMAEPDGGAEAKRAALTFVLRLLKLELAGKRRDHMVKNLLGRAGRLRRQLDFIELDLPPDAPAGGFLTAPGDEAGRAAAERAASNSAEE